MSVLRAALSGLRARRGRLAAAALGVAAASAMLGTAITVGYGLSTGFERAAERADLPDVIARFDDEDPAEVARRVRSLANVEASSSRLEVTNVRLAARGRSTGKGSVHVVGPGRRGYAIVEGRDLRGRADEVVIERGLSEEWGLEPGDSLGLGRLGEVRVAGVAVGPDNVAFPLASAARVYVSNEGLRRRFGSAIRPVNVLMVWLRDRSRLDTALVQARTSSFGVEGLRFVTREGVKTLVSRAAGIVIALLVALSLVAIGAAGVMLGSAARAEVERRLPAIGVERVVGFGRAPIAARQAGEALLVTLPAALAGLGLGVLVAGPPSARLLSSLNELSPGAALVGPLALALLGVTALVTAAAGWPAWRAASRPPAELLRGAELRGGRGLGLRLPGLAGLGARLALVRRVRAASTVATLGVAVAVVLLLLALASLLTGLRDDPASVGKRYELTAKLPESLLGEVRRLPGVAAAAPRFQADAVGSFSLGQPFRLIAFPGDHGRFEAPPLDEGRRPRAPDEVEVGLGLAQELGLRRGGTLAVTLPSGAETRFRVVGITRALENEGRIAYVQPPRLLGAEAALEPTLAVDVGEGADEARVRRGLAALGGAPGRPGTATSANSGFLGTLAGVLRAVAGVNALVCLVALMQALGLVVRERRAALGVLRATGAGGPALRRVLAGAALAVALPALVLGAVLERLVLGPLVARLAADYAPLELTAGPGQLAAVAVGLAVIAVAAVAWVAARLEREPVVAALAEDAE